MKNRNFMRIFCAFALCVLVFAQFGICANAAGSVPSVKPEEPVGPACNHFGTVQDSFPYVPATCANAGHYAYYKCQCGALLGYVEIPATGNHDYEVVHTDATCDVNGSDIQVCKNCKAVGEHVAIEAFGHDWSNWMPNPQNVNQEYRVCKNDATHIEYRNVYVDPNVDASPKTGDMTGVISATVVTAVALMAAVAFVFKRKAI